MLSNLVEDYFYNLLPAVVQDEDPRGITSSVVGGFQDRIEDLRALLSQYQEIYDPSNIVGQAFPVVIASYISSSGKQINVNLVIDSSTPAASDTAALTDWAAAQMGLSSTDILSVSYGVDSYKTAETSFTSFLADTIGARLYLPLGSSTSEAPLIRQQIVLNHFARLKVKGTELSFQILGKLLGFDSVKYTPLWSRYKIRLPSDVGNSINDIDFSVEPDIEPTASLPDLLYDPQNYIDGPPYTWVSPVFVLDESKTNYLPLVVNDKNPFIKIKVVGDVSELQPGTYILTNGGQSKFASTGLIPNRVDGTSSGIEIIAAIAGEGLNGSSILVTTPSDTYAPQLIITQNLSLIKYKSSYFDLSLAVNLDSYKASQTVSCESNSDLVINPYLTIDGIAVAPYRPWTGGYTGQPTVTVWPQHTIVPSSDAQVARTQATAADNQLELSQLIDGSIAIKSAIEDIRSATRFPRRIGSGFSFEDTAGYAPYPYKKIIVSISSNGNYDTILVSPGSDFPLPDYSGSFYVNYNSVDHVIPSVTDINNSNIVNLSYNSDGISFTGNYNFSLNELIITVSSTSTQFSIFSLWNTTTSDIIRNEPTDSDKASDLVCTYSNRPEDSVDFEDSIYSYQDDYSWRRTLTGSGELQLEDYYIASTGDTINRVDSSVVVTSNTGQEYNLTALDSITGIIPAVKSSVASGVGGQPATASSGNNNYAVGLVQGSLFADPTAHWTPAHKDGLSGWFKLNEHPLDGYMAIDSSDMALTAEEISSGAFTSTYNSESRTWTDTKGWVLQLNAPQYFSVSKARNLGKSFTFTYWISPYPPTESGKTSTLFNAGPVRIQSGDQYQTAGSHWYDLTVFVEDAQGIEHAAGVYTIKQNVFQFISLVLTELDRSNRSLVRLVSTSNVQNLQGLQQIDGIQTLPGDTILLTGQTSPILNGTWVVNTGTWVRAALNTNIGPTDPVFIEVEEGPSANIYRLASTLPVNVGTSPLVYDTANTLVTVYSDTMGTFDLKSSVYCNMREYTADDLNVTVKSDYVNYRISDLRIYSVAKTFNDLSLIRSPNFKPISVPWVTKSFLNAKKSARYELQVLSNGSVYPKQVESNYSLNRYLRIIRYNYLGEFVSNNFAKEEIGFGDGSVLPSSSKLGLTGVDYDSTGAGIFSTRTGAKGLNQVWLTDAGTGYPRSEYNWPNDSTNVDVPVFGSSTVPASQDELNTAVNHIFIKGDDNLLYKINVQADIFGSYLVAQDYYTLRQGNISSDPRARIQEQLTSEESKAEQPSVTSLITVSRDALGELQITESATSTLAYDPPKIYLYSHRQDRLKLNTADPAVVSDPTTWINFNTWGLTLGVVGRESAGLISLSGASAGIVPVGNYLLEFDVTNRGNLDSTFSGYQVEVTIGQNTIVTGLLMTSGQPYWSLNFVNSNTGKIPANQTPSEFVDLLNTLPDIVSVGGVSLASGYNSQYGGPYYIQFNQVGQQTLVVPSGESSVTAASQVLVSGDASTQEIQKIIVTRPKSYVNLAITTPTSANWLLDLNWTNDKNLPQYNQYRKLCIHSVKLIKLQTQLFRLDFSPLTLAELDLSHYSFIIPGGWQGLINENGTLSYLHEGLTYSTSNISGDTAYNPTNSAAASLTGSTINKTDYIMRPVMTLLDTPIPGPISSSIQITDIELPNDIVQGQII